MHYQYAPVTLPSPAAYSFAARQLVVGPTARQQHVTYILTNFTTKRVDTTCGTQNLAPAFFSADDVAYR